MPNEWNIPSRTIFTGDNLDILRGVNSDCVDLIYLDPPFNSNQTYAAPLDSEAKGAEFDDVWTLNDMRLNFACPRCFTSSTLVFPKRAGLLNPTQSHPH